MKCLLPVFLVDSRSIAKEEVNFHMSCSHIFYAFFFRDHTFTTFIRKEDEWGSVLKFATCFQILLFLNNRSIAYFSAWGWVGRLQNWLFFVDIINL